MIQITALPAFTDNYIWLLQDPRTRRCAVVDPGDAAPVQAWLKDNPQWILSDILITHHHHDHTGGLAKLIKRRVLPVPGVEKDPEALRDYIRTVSKTVFHPSGTCKMGEDPRAVVDSRIDVFNQRGVLVMTYTATRLLAGRACALHEPAHGAAQEIHAVVVDALDLRQSGGRVIEKDGGGKVGCLVHGAILNAPHDMHRTAPQDTSFSCRT